MVKILATVKERREKDLIPDIETKLLDLPDSCLDIILRQLPLLELAEVANAHSHIKTRAICVHRLNNFPLKLSTSDFYRPNEFVSVMEAFGAIMVDITIKSDDEQKMIDALVKYCRKTLKMLSIEFNETAETEIQISQPFVNLERLNYDFDTSNCNELWITKIDQLFPMMRDLTMTIRRQIPKIHNLLLGKTIKSLKSLHLYSHLRTSDHQIGRNFARSNPQLELLCVNRCVTDKTFRKSGWQSSNISTLKLKTSDEITSLRYLMELQKLRHLDITAEKCYSCINNLKLPELETLKIKSIGNDEEILKFISNCIGLTKLHIDLNRKSLSNLKQIPSNISQLSLMNSNNLSLMGINYCKKLFNLDLFADEYPDIEHVDLPNLKFLMIKLTKDMDLIIIFIKKCRNLTELWLVLDCGFSLSPSDAESLTKALMNLKCLNLIECTGINDEDLEKSLRSIPKKVSPSRPTVSADFDADHRKIEKRSMIQTYRNLSSVSSLMSNFFNFFN